MKNAPHVIPYQGSKRKLAEDILSLVNFPVKTLYEPFAGSAAITLAAAANHYAERFVVADKLEPLAELWKLIIFNPDQLIEEYSMLWYEQLENPADYYKKVRSDFNKTQSPSRLLYLIARCVKNAVRFNGGGEFNQGPDNRRLGLKPEKLQKEVYLTSKLLKDNIDIFGGDFRDTLKRATENDLIYLDPPWQGTSGSRDPRYAFLLNMDELTAELNSLNQRNIPYMLSFDGACGAKIYGANLPEFLRLTKIPLRAGRSSQATLLGRDDITIESLYLSPSFVFKSGESWFKKENPQMSFLGIDDFI